MMTGHLAIHEQFIDDGRLDRSKESFQGIVFKDFMQEAQVAISFHRSDFRGASILRCHFKGNDFSRADFISTRFISSSFSECDFAISHMSNSVFEDCSFCANVNFNPDLYRCDLFDCTFVNQNVFRSTWRDNRFKNCEFKNFSIEKSTIENVIFEDCDLEGVDLSQVSAIDIVFKNCNIKNIILDPDYVGSYMFLSTPLDNVKFSYRSNDLEFSLLRYSDVISLGKHFETQDRWSEAFNLQVIGLQVHPGRFTDSVIAEEWMYYASKSIESDIPSDAAENIARMFRVARFYLESGVISISSVLMILSFSDELCRARLNVLVNERLCTGKALLLESLHNLINIEELIALDQQHGMMVQFQVQIESDDAALVEHLFRDVTTRVLNTTGIPCTVTRIGYGSVLVEAVSLLLFVLVFFRLARSASYNMAEIKIVNQVEKRVSEIVRDSKDAASAIAIMKEFKDNLPKEPPISKMMIKETTEIGKTVNALSREIRSSSSELLSLVKEVRIFLNSFRK